MSGDQSKSPIRFRCRYQGRVQGVGFRYTTASLARKHPVTGYVMNLSDGSVELVAEGLWSDVSHFLSEVQLAFTQNITDINQDELPATGEFSDFRTRHGR